ncbi:IclR family transcriptional regulator [Streptomyces sp. NPDC002668]|uniref:IclR family transcriptional regulator n=1 Tax=Streptomyces sp. NPDC002668 TaxID=3154422 RepID=UPI00332B4D30
MNDNVNLRTLFINTEHQGNFRRPAAPGAAPILQESTFTGPRPGVAELADCLGVAKPTPCTHCCAHWGAKGLLMQDRDRSKCRLGPLLAQLGNAYLGAEELRARSLTWADPLARRVNEAVWVAVLTSDHALVVHDAFRPESAVQIHEVGTSPVEHLRLGEAIAKFAPAAVGERLLAGEPAVCAGASTTDPEELDGQLKEALGTGCAAGSRSPRSGTRASPLLSSTVPARWSAPSELLAPLSAC